MVCSQFQYPITDNLSTVARTHTGNQYECIQQHHDIERTSHPLRIFGRKYTDTDTFMYSKPNYKQAMFMLHTTDRSHMASTTVFPRKAWL